MGSFYEPAAQTIHVSVVYDGSDTSREVFAQLSSLPDVAIKACLVEEMSGSSVENDNNLFIFVVGEGSDTERFHHLLQSNTLQSMLITDSPILFQQLGSM